MSDFGDITEIRHLKSEVTFVLPMLVDTLLRLPNVAHTFPRKYDTPDCRVWQQNT
jgi:hypothetical protein